MRDLAKQHWKLWVARAFARCLGIPSSEDALEMAEEARTDWDSYHVGLKVLAVDDDPLCLKVVEQMLRRCNYEGAKLSNLKIERDMLNSCGCFCASGNALRSCLYAVKTADNGKDALAKLRERDSQIDLVLSDVYMPGQYLRLQISILCKRTRSFWALKSAK